MNWVAVAVIVIVAVPVLLFAAWQILQEVRVRIDSGTVGLLMVRGVATERALEPGAHFVWPYRQNMIQIYPLRELSYVAGPGDRVDDADLVDAPLPVSLGDRTAAVISYTIRFRIRPEQLREIHERVGPDGIKRLIRDRSRALLLARLGDSSTTYADLFGDARAELQAALAETLADGLAEDGFTMNLFTLHNIDLGETGEVLQAAVRGAAELEREQAAAAIRLARARSEVELNALLAGGLGDDLLRYRQIEVWREYVQRWDGRLAAPPSTAQGPAPSTPPAEADERRDVPGLPG